MSQEIWAYAELVKNVHNLKELFSNEAVKGLLKTGQLVTVYELFNWMPIKNTTQPDGQNLKAKFTQALYNSNINPFKYLQNCKDEGVRYGILEEMFTDVVTENVVIPNCSFTWEFAKHMFENSHINKLIIEGSQAYPLLDTNVFSGAEINTMLFDDESGFFNMEESASQESFTNNGKPLTIILKQLNYYTESDNTEENLLMFKEEIIKGNNWFSPIFPRLKSNQLNVKVMG